MCNCWKSYKKVWLLIQVCLTLEFDSDGYTLPAEQYFSRYMIPGCRLGFTGASPSSLRRADCRPGFSTACSAMACGGHVASMKSALVRICHQRNKYMFQIRAFLFQGPSLSACHWQEASCHQARNWPKGAPNSFCSFKY